MRRIISILTLSAFSTFCPGQNFKAEFDKYYEEGDTAKQFDVLTEWQKQEPKSAELFTSYFNYYFQKSRHEILSLTGKPPEGESLSFQDSTGNSRLHRESSNFQ